MTHLLNIDIPDLLTPCILRIVDLSSYDALLPYTNPQLVIQVPGGPCITFNQTTTPAITQNFAVNLTACDLTLQVDNCGLQLYDLPDGIYTIDYSVAPNNMLMTQVQHLRDVKLRLALREAIAHLDIGTCIPEGEVKDKFELLMLIEGYIKAAKSFVELPNGDCKKGMALYHYAWELLKKLSCKNC